MGKGGCAETKTSSTPLSATLKKKREISPSFLATKKSINECWIAYDGVVYDVTGWIAKHPGGIRAIMSCAGHDASSVMKSLHTPKTLKTYMNRVRKVGMLIDDAIDPNSEVVQDQKTIKPKTRSQAIHRDFDVLSERLLKEGWYDATPELYWAAVIRAASFLFFGLMLVLLGNYDFEEDNSWQGKVALILGSMLIGFYFQNIAFMGHDAGHGSISGDFHMDNWLGFLLGNLFTGIDIGWWKSTHYAHHSSTNCVHEDPDIQHLPLLCFEERMADDMWSAYHGKFMPLNSIGRAIVPFQHWYFYPVMAVARFNLYIQSILYLFDTRPFLNAEGTVENIIDMNSGEVKEKYAWPKPPLHFWMAQVISLSGFHYLWFCFLSHMDFTSAITFVLISHFTAGILHVQILISHTAMNYCTGGSGAEGAICTSDGSNETGYYEWQALSTMDVACPPWMDWAHGGLNFQLEHHLFPRVPRWKLRELMPLVDEIFNKYDIPVTRVPFIDANRMMLKHLANVGVLVAKHKTV